MTRAVRIAFLGLLIAGAAAGASAGCSVPNGLYDGWLALSKRGSSRAAPRNEALVAAGAEAPAEPEQRQAIGKEYQAFFECLSDAAGRKDKPAIATLCKESEEDRLAALVCQGVQYVVGGRTDGKGFLEAFPSGKKGSEMVWDLEAIGAAAPAKSSTSAVFPDGPAFKLIDELFLLVLDNDEAAATRYFNILSYAPGGGVKHMDDQLKLLVREAPSVVVDRWAIIRQHQSKLKRIFSEMTASMPAAEIAKLRKGLAGFCKPDNPDCPEIRKIFGKAE
jgi:hypothetical protein